MLVEDKTIQIETDDKEVLLTVLKNEQERTELAIFKMWSDIEEFQRDQAKIGQEATDQENDAAYRMLSRLQKDKTKIQSGVTQCTNELEALNNANWLSLMKKLDKTD
jgi:hypothetical protein